MRPAITHAGLARRNRTIVTIDRGGFRLRLFKRLRYDRSYPIAVGAAGFDTPSGLFRISDRRVNPSWTAPNRPWAGSYAGRTVPGGAPDNPLKARWLGVTGSVGIHGTARVVVDRQPRVARLHPDARERRDRPVSARALRHAGADPPR